MKLLFINVLSVLLFKIIPVGIPELQGQSLSRDLHVDLLVNQVGYVPQAGKTVVTRGIRTGKYELIDIETQKTVYSGFFKPCPSDLGEYSVGDFSSHTLEGHYYIKSDTLRSYPFAISKSVYHSPMDLIVNYFSMQRCGASTTGYLSPCHLDDGVRTDNGKHQDVTGGWHDASDLRKWVIATIYGMIGLGKTYELMDKNCPGREKIMEELMWGNQYFLKMQEPQGYIMSFVGGDVRKHSDSNRWTDNEIGTEGGEPALVKPTAGRSTQDMLIFGTKDDRVIQTKPANIQAQYNFITSQAIMARITKATDNNYSEKCLQAAENCFNWCVEDNKRIDPGILGASIQASIEMYKTTKRSIYKDFAVAQALKLKALQVKKHEESVGGYFRSSFTDQEPYKHIWYGCLEFISLCDLTETFPAHKDSRIWKEIIGDYSNHYLVFISQKNSFGIVPYGLFTGKDPGGNRKTGNHWYRYFMQPELNWWAGINANIASAGVGLMKAARILNNPELEAVAQKQLDWIIGVNPFNSSTIVSVGYNQPEKFSGGGFYPFTPVIHGAVMNGLGGDSSDQPVKGDGNWQISEYWTPMAAYTLWLMAEMTPVTL